MEWNRNLATREIIKIKMAYAIHNVDCCRLSFCFFFAFLFVRWSLFLMRTAEQMPPIVLIEYNNKKITKRGGNTVSTASLHRFCVEHTHTHALFLGYFMLN